MADRTKPSVADSASTAVDSLVLQELDSQPETIINEQSLSLDIPSTKTEKRVDLEAAIAIPEEVPIDLTTATVLEPEPTAQAEQAAELQAQSGFEPTVEVEPNETENSSNNSEIQDAAIANGSYEPEVKEVFASPSPETSTIGQTDTENIAGDLASTGNEPDSEINSSESTSSTQSLSQESLSEPLATERQDSIQQADQTLEIPPDVTLSETLDSPQVPPVVLAPPSKPHRVSIPVQSNAQESFPMANPNLRTPAKSQLKTVDRRWVAVKPEGEYRELRLHTYSAYSLSTWRLSYPLPEVATTTSGFGWRQHPIEQQLIFHRGIDLAAPEGTIVQAIQTGRVLFTGWLSGSGLTVILEHADHETLYAHLSEITVQAGQFIQAGQTLGKVGHTGLATGPHLHFEITDEQGQAIDPAPILQQALATQNFTQYLANLPRIIIPRRR